MKFSSRGFTLVELMIVIAIIGILAAALFPSLTAYLKRSRDAGRSANLNTVATAIGAYYSDHEAYPSTSTGCVDTTLLPSNYLPKGVPVDPTSSKHDNGCNGAANYGYGSTGGTVPGWVLLATFENTNWGNLVSLTPGNNTLTGTMAISSNTLTTTYIQKGTGAVFALTN